MVELESQPEAFCLSRRRAVRDFTQDALQEDDLSLLLARYSPAAPDAAKRPRLSDPNGTGA